MGYFVLLFTVVSTLLITCFVIYTCKFRLQFYFSTHNIFCNFNYNFLNLTIEFFYPDFLILQSTGEMLVHIDLNQKYE